MRGLLLSCWIALSISPAIVHGAGLTDEQLAAKAARLQSLVEEKLLQHHGLVPMFVRASDYQLPTADDYQGAYRHRHLRGKTEAELGLPPMHVWRAWENTAADTGYYLYAMSHKYRATGDPATLAICRRTFGGLKYIYTLAVEQGEPGFLTKPYGGVYSNQTSGDQLQCVAWGLTAYRPIAPPEDLADLDRMTRDFALHQMDTDYTNLHGYFGRSRQDLVEANAKRQWGWYRSIIFLPALYLAWDGTGDDRFAEEIERLNAKAGDSNLRARTDRFRTHGFGGKRELYLSSYLMARDPAHHKLWREAMLTHYRQARTGLLDDGTWPTAWSYDSERGMQVEPMPSVGGGVGRTGRSAVFAMGCVSAQRWFDDPAMQHSARSILERLDEPTFRFVLPLDEEHPLPPEWVIESELLDADCLTAWLAAYWEGHYRGYW
ncbi:hypothetical protein [Aeoliella sp.]|uniref:hypothetical protein n=1 Tax=Aeoliella sp. TaxID=2795800 RepID=UPI003CCB7EDC